MDHSKNQIVNKSTLLGVSILSIGTCLMYFNPLNLNNEVFPYFALGLLFLNISYRLFIILLGLFSLAILWLIYQPNARSLIDAANLIFMLIGCSMFYKLDESGKSLVIKIFSIFLAINCLVCLLQYLSEDFQLLTNTFFHAEYRPSVLDTVKSRTGGVTGLGPEPAYTAALVVGLGMIVSGYNPKKLHIILIVLLTLIFLRSVSGFFYGFIYLSFVLLRQSYDVVYLVGRASLILLPILFVFFYTNLSKYEWIRPEEIIDRLVLFYTLFIESGNLLEAEENFGSNRLIGVYNAFSKLFFTSYETGFSPAAALNFLSATSLTSVIIGFMLLLKKGRGLSYLPCLLFVIISGPKLIWPLFYFGLFGTENIKDIKKL